MEYTISATNARIHFGEIMRRAKLGPVIVERSGKAEVVVISKSEYDQLKQNAPKKDWMAMRQKLHEKLLEELDGAPLSSLPDPAEMIRLAREERDEQLLSTLR